MSSNNIIVSVKNVKRKYSLGGEEIWALRGVDLEIYKGEYLSIMGPSGSGKSTLFNMIGGLDVPTEGTVIINGYDMRKLTHAQIAYLRSNTFGYIFQNFNLIPVLSALENVMLPLIFSGVSDKIAEERAVELLKKVGLGNRLFHRPDQLSGGQQQRVAIARALANNPSIILADEPTGNLDLKTGEEIIYMLAKLRDEFGITIITATHDHKMLATSNRVVYLEDGKIVTIKSRKEIEIVVGQIDGES